MNELSMRRETSDELLERAARDTPELPPEVFPLRTTLDVGRLDEIVSLLRRPIEVPELGEAAAKAMSNCFESVARDVLAIASDGVDRAAALLKEAETFAEIVRKNGEVLCDRIRAESVRGLKISEVMRAARSVVGEPLSLDRNGLPGGGEPASKA